MSTYDRRTRDRYRQVVTGVTGIAGVGALTLTGGLMGMASGEAAQTQEKQAAEQEAAQQAQLKAQRRAERRAAAPRSPLRERPHVTRVTTRYVTGGTSSSVSSSGPGPGGTVSSSSGSRRKLELRAGTRTGTSSGSGAAAGTDQWVLMRTHAQSVHAEFAAFGTYGYLAVRRPEALPRALRITQTVIEDVDATCSRFRADSDLARVNREPGRWVDVHPLLVEAVRVAVGAAAATDGMVHPLLGRPLVTLGYDRDFRELREVETAPTDPPAPAVDAWRSIELDEARVRIPAGTALDLGSTAKAWAADVVAAGLEQELGEPALVSLGGDIMISAPDGVPWRVAVAEQPSDLRERPACRVDLTAGRPRDVEHARPPVDTSGHGATPPARPPDRRAGRGGVAHRDRHRSVLRRRQHRHHGRRRPRRRGRALARPA